MGSIKQCPYCDGIVDMSLHDCPHCKRRIVEAQGSKYCQNCGTVGRPKRFTKGSFLMEVLLWLMLIVPGVIYSLWRLTTKAWVCPKCQSDQIIPVDSPKARAALAKA